MSHLLRGYGTGHDNTGKIAFLTGKIVSKQQQVNGVKFTKKYEKAIGSVLEPN